MSSARHESGRVENRRFPMSSPPGTMVLQPILGNDLRTDGAQITSGEQVGKGGPGRVR